MVRRSKIHHLISKSKISPQTLSYHLRQSIEVEKIKLETYESSNLDTLDSFEKIMEGERLLRLLSVTM